MLFDLIGEYFKGVFTVIGIILLIILVASGIWIYNDSKKRNMNSGIWVLTIILTGCFGCLIYLIVSDPIGGIQPSQQIEPTLNNTLNSTIKSSQKYCTNCGMEIETDAGFCIGCGIKL